MGRTSGEIRDVAIERFVKLSAEKFDVGQEEHGGCLDETVTFDKLEEEIIDMWFYTQSLKVKVGLLEVSLRHQALVAEVENEA
jgi:hypothetical protein